jgi:hypothetical protein
LRDKLDAYRSNRRKTLAGSGSLDLGLLSGVLLRNALFEEIGNETGWPTGDQIFLPAGRAFFSSLRSSVFGFLSANNKLDPLLREFGRFYEGLRAGIPRRGGGGDKELRRRVDEMSTIILAGEYVRERGRDYIKPAPDRKVVLAAASPGQQAVFPLLRVLAALPLMSEKTGQIVYVEEPEAHQSPITQRRLVDLTATVFNASKMPLQFVVTTHSPYVLTAVRNLVAAGRVRATADAEYRRRLDAVVSPAYVLRPDDVVIHRVREGRCEILGDEDSDVFVEDSVAGDLALQFRRIQELG